MKELNHCIIKNCPKASYSVVDQSAFQQICLSTKKIKTTALKVLQLTSSFNSTNLKTGARLNCSLPTPKHIVFAKEVSPTIASGVGSASWWSLQKRYYATIRRKDHKFPELRDEDLEEEFVRGSGPGGQSVNKTSNCVVLKHLPTGTVVKCHETRSLEENRKRARLRLEEKLDLDINGDQSYLSKVKAEGEEAKREKKRRSSRRLALKTAFKEREGLE
ncbi:peptide chain release factor 1 [Elysia marginata]|uniref:Peptide chain release factor 1 n=1 Tax=Elysia marginata TaxID=1093978 RepID=A0AAV4GNV7_9GAST|nr:peptide chain release factor 1 [Elysia marginata]